MNYTYKLSVSRLIDFFYFLTFYTYLLFVIISKKIMKICIFSSEVLFFSTVAWVYVSQYILASGRDQIQFSVIIGLSIVVMDATRACGMSEKTHLPSVQFIMIIL